MFEEIPINNRYGYVRVSSKGQQNNSSIDSQIAELEKHGIPVENIRTEVKSASDSIKNREVLSHLVENELEKNSLLVVTKLDRCSRNTLEFLKLQERLFQKSVTFIALDLPYSDDMAVNKLIATNLAAIATFETERRKERQRQGILAAKKEGKYKGRKTVITKKLITDVKNWKEQGLSVTQIALLAGKGRTTIYKILKNELNYVPANKLIQKETYESSD